MVGLCEATLELAQQKAEALGIEKAYVFEEMLQDPSIDSVHICTPNFLHYSQAKAALLAGKHVICEKPLATKIEDAEELVQLAREKGLVNATHFNLRYYPMVRQMKTMREIVFKFNIHHWVNIFMKKLKSLIFENLIFFVLELDIQFT